MDSDGQRGDAPLKNRRLVMRTVGATAIGLGLAQAGCKNQDKDKSRDTGAPSLSLQAPWFNDAEFLGYFVAIERGFYKEAGLGFTYYSGGPEVVADMELIAKRATVALTNPETTVNLITKQGADLKIIGTQYQKSPLGIVSLKKNGIASPQDLIGKRVAVPAANVLTLERFLLSNGVDPKRVSMEPYLYDPTPLITGKVDATVDFVTNVPFTIAQARAEPSSFLLADFGFSVFMDTVVVRGDVLNTQRAALKSFLSASRQGWSFAFSNSERAVGLVAGSYFKNNKRTIENEIFFNRAQQPLMDAKEGYFSMSENGIAETIESLNKIGLNATRAMFDTTILAELPNS